MQPVGQSAVRDERGEVASWLIIMAALAAAAVLAAGVLRSTVTQLASNVETAALQGEHQLGGGNPGVPAGGDPGVPAGGDPDAEVAELPDDGGDVAPDAADNSERPTPGQFDQLRQLQQQIESGDEAASEQRQQDLRELVDGLVDDPAQAAEVYDLILAGATPELAYAQASGDWTGIPGGDPSQYSDDNVRAILQTLGIDIPPGLDDYLPDGTDELLDAIPPWLLAALFNQGQTNSIELGPGIGTSTTLLPLGVSANLVVGVSTSLSDPRVGVGFDQTQSVAITAEMLTRGEFAAGRSTLNTVYSVLDGLGRVPQPVQDLLNRSPLLRGVARGVPFRVAYDQWTGTELAYEATITTDQGARVAAGDLSVLPDLYDPSTFQPGNAVLIRGGDVTGSSFALRYKLLEVGGSNADFEGTGFGMTRLANGRLAVYSGPIESIESQSYLGLPFAGLAGSRELTESQFLYAELDDSTPEGRAALQDFISSGEVPDTDGVGIVTADTTTLTYDDDLDFRIDLGPFQSDTSIRDNSTIYQVTDYSDGRAEVNVTYNINEATVNVVAPVEGDFADYEKAVATVVLEDIEPQYTRALHSMFGESQRFGESQHVQLQFAPADIDHLIEAAQADVRWRFGDNYDLVVANPAIGSLAEQLASAPNRGEAIHRLMVHTRTFGSTETVMRLTSIGNNSRVGLTGTIDSRSAP
jgi:hypothetical protein